MPARLALAGADGATAYLDLTALTPEQEDALAAWLADAEAPKVLHDAKEQLQALSTRGLDRSPASPATPRWRPTWCVPTSAPTTSRTSSCATSAAS